jgi:hypothetical protein
MPAYMPKATKHEWMMLVPNGHSYTRFVSDLAGYDPKHHDGTKENVVTAVMAWLWVKPGAVRQLDPPAVVSALPAFEYSRQQLALGWGEEPPWELVVSAAVDATP